MRIVQQNNVSNPSQSATSKGGGGDSTAVGSWPFFFFEQVAASKQIKIHTCQVLEFSRLYSSYVTFGGGGGWTAWQIPKGARSGLH